jgi:hypothetical protein
MNAQPMEYVVTVEGLRLAKQKVEDDIQWQKEMGRDTKRLELKLEAILSLAEKLGVTL